MSHSSLKTSRPPRKRGSLSIEQSAIAPHSYERKIIPISSTILFLGLASVAHHLCCFVNRYSYTLEVDPCLSLKQSLWASLRILDRTFFVLLSDNKKWWTVHWEISWTLPLWREHCSIGIDKLCCIQEGISVPDYIDSEYGDDHDNR